MGPEAVAKQIQGSGMQIPGSGEIENQKKHQNDAFTVSVFSGAVVGFWLLVLI